LPPADRSFAEALQALYAAEIDVHLNSWWDAGWLVELADGRGRRVTRHFPAGQFAELQAFLVHHSFEFGGA
jgi:hypothetical protein